MAPVATLPMPWQLIQQSIIEGGDGFVLLESPYGFILLRDKLGKWALQVEEISHQSADITFVFQFAFCFRKKKTHVWIAWEQNKRELQLELEGKG